MHRQRGSKWRMEKTSHARCRRNEGVQLKGLDIFLEGLKVQREKVVWLRQDWAVQVSLLTAKVCRGSLLPDQLFPDEKLV